MSKTVKCPDCQEMSPKEEAGIIIIPVDSQVGEVLECPNCGAEVEIISLDPPVVVLIEEEK